MLSLYLALVLSVPGHADVSLAPPQPGCVRADPVPCSHRNRICGLDLISRLKARVDSASGDPKRDDYDRELRSQVKAYAAAKDRCRW